MATCAELEKQAQQTATSLAQATVRGEKLLQQPIPNTKNPSEVPAVKLQLTALSNSINIVNADINKFLNQLSSIKSQQGTLNCTVTGYFPTIKLANNTLIALQNKSNTVTQTFNSLPSVGTQDAGVVPGQGILVTPPTEQDLTVVTVIGNAPPRSQLQPGDVNIPTDVGNINVPPPNFINTEVDTDQDENLNGPGGDGLTEVEITARKRSNELKGDDQNLIKGPTDKVNQENADADADTLDEVVITATRPKPTTTGAVQNTRNQASLRQETNFEARRDWRVKLSLSPGATYLYNDQSNVLLSPLAGTNGVIFPYTPSVQVGYSASYGNYRPSGSNYAYPYYDSSSIDSITITGDFTAQDNFEANYLLAVIHFFRSVTKMFYAKDSNPKAGTPPPVLFLTGFGQFMFNNHPLVITNFTYTTPTDVDYIRAGAFSSATPGAAAGAAADAAPKKSVNWNWGTLLQNTIQKTLGSGAAAIGNFLNFNKDFNVLTPGGELGQANWTYSGFQGFNAGEAANPTYVPTKLQIQLSAVPILSRLDVSNYFSLKDYSNGKLLSGYNGKGKGAGFW